MLAAQPIAPTSISCGDKNNNKLYAYCADLNTSSKPNYRYKMVEIENSDYWQRLIDSNLPLEEQEEDTVTSSWDPLSDPPTHSQKTQPSLTGHGLGEPPKVPGTQEDGVDQVRFTS